MLPKCPHCDGQLNLSADEQKLVTIVCPACGQDIKLADILLDSFEGFGFSGLGDDDAELSLELDVPTTAGSEVADDADLDLMADLDDDDDIGELLVESAAAAGESIDEEEELGDWLTDDAAPIDTDLETGEVDTQIDANAALSPLDLESTAAGSDGESKASEEPPFAVGEATEEDKSAGVFEFEPSFEEGLVEATAESAATETTDHAPVQPFDMARPKGSATLTAAPPVPKRNGSIARIGKLLGLAALLLVLAQVVIWWALKIDPIGLAAILPTPLSLAAPQELRMKEIKGFKFAPLLPPDPSLPRAENGSIAAAPPPEPEPREENEASRDSGFAADDADEIPRNVEPPESESLPNDQRNMQASEDAAGIIDDSDSNESLAESLDNSLDDPMDSASDELSLSDNQSFNASDSAEGDLVESATDGLGMEGESTGTAEAIIEKFDTPESMEDDMLAELLEEVPTSDADAGDRLGADPPPVVEPASVFDRYRPLGAASFSPNDVAAKIAAARRMHESFDQAWLVGGKSQEEVAAVREAARAFYVSFAELAEQATLVNRDGAEEVLNESRRLLDEFKLNGKKPPLISRTAAGWLASDERTKAGILLSGKVEQIQTLGDWNEVVVRLSDRERSTVTLVTQLNPTKNDLVPFDEGDELILLGLIVDEPDLVLPGFGSAASRVIYVTDLIVKLP